MTFIASVIARDGVAIVADSFGTAEEHLLDADTLVDFLTKNKKKKNISIIELSRLFETRPSHTRNYQDKLVQFDKNSAITITGLSAINDKPLKDTIRSIAASLQADKAAYGDKKIEVILQEICDLLKVEVLEHLKKDDISATDLIFSHYNKSEETPQIFVIKIKRIDNKSFDPGDPNLIIFEDQSGLKIVSDGQDTYVDRLIFGSLYKNSRKVKEFFLTYMLKKFKISKSKRQEVIKEVLHFDFMKELIQKDIYYIKFRELSLQEAVDFAALLIKIVMDIQIYTEKIPTVGGLIRLAVITKDEGFTWVSGTGLLIPKIV